MKGIIPGVGALMTWTIIPGMGVQIFLIGCYPSTGGQQDTVEAVKDLRRHGMSPRIATQEKDDVTIPPRHMFILPTSEGVT
jgi:hypothetical protein